jgi:hypothetical protein
MRIKADRAIWLAAQAVMGRMLASLAARRHQFDVAGDWQALMVLHSLHRLHGRIIAATHTSALAAGTRQLSVKVELHEAAAFMAAGGEAQAALEGCDDYHEFAWRQLQAKIHECLINN